MLINSYFKNEGEYVNTLNESPNALLNQHLRSGNYKSVKLIASNLDSSISFSEWRRILSEHFKSITENSFYIRIVRQSGARLCAIASLSNLEDAKRVISHLNQQRIGNRRIYVGFYNSDDQNYSHKPKISNRNQPKIERKSFETPANYVPKVAQKTFEDNAKSPPVHRKCLNNLKIENSVRPELNSTDRQENTQVYTQQDLPSVFITLAELHPNVLKLLQENNNLIPVKIFTRCYEESFGPFKTPNSANVKKEEEDCEKTFVPLEHLITSIPGVNIENSKDRLRVVKLSIDPPKEALDDDSSSEVMRQLRHEVVDLIKQQPGYCVLLSKFFSSYHSRFNKQFRVTNYGYTRLQDLFECLKGVVHIVGQGPHRTIMLTHLTQVRRFTHELQRMLKTQQRKYLRVDEIPQIYQTVFNKELHLSNYGVCTIYDLLNYIPENKLVIQKVKDDADLVSEHSVVVIPQRMQTVEQRYRTNLFALEAIDILSTSQSFQIPFTKFIPAYHHAFNRQCKVSDYGFIKFIELLEAMPQIAEVMVENGERHINLTLPLRLALIRQMLLEVLQSQIGHQILLNDLVTAFYTKYQLTLLPQDCGFGTLEEMLSSFTDIAFLSKVEQQKHDSESVFTESKADDSPVELSESQNSESKINKTLVILVDRNEIRLCAYRCLKVLLNLPFGWISENEFRDSFRAKFNEEIDLEFVSREMSPFILVKDFEVKNTAGTDMELNVQSSRIVQLCPLILLAQQIRFLLTGTRGRLMITFLEEAYRRNFGINLCPEVYGYPSVITLLNALKFAVATKGHGTRTAIFLAPDFLGKMAWMIAYKIPFRHDLIDQFQNESTDLLKTMINPPNICLQPIGSIFPWGYPLTPESQPPDFAANFPPLSPESTYFEQGLNYPNVPPIDYPNELFINNFPLYQYHGMTPVSLFTYPMITSDQTRAPFEYPQPYYMNPQIDMSFINQPQLINGNIEEVHIKQEPDSVSLSEEAFKSGSAYPTWIPKEGPFMLTHSYQNLTFPDLQMAYHKEEPFNSFSTPLQWPIFPLNPPDTHLTIAPQAMILNGGVYAENPFGFTSTPCTINEPNNSTPVTNKCEEGDWTLPISMTTESINDTNAKENDITENIE